MPATPTAKLNLYKSASDGSEDVDYTEDIGNNLDKIDSAMGFTVCTSSTRPSSPYVGQAIYEGDTHRMYVWTSGTWTEIAVPGAVPVFTAGLAATQTTPAGIVFAAADDGDAQRRFGIKADGTLQWGTGAAAEDTNLYRSAANTLKTDDSLVVAGDAAVTGNLAVTGIGAVIYARKTADTARATTTLSADPHLTVSVVAGATYELHAELAYGVTADTTDFDNTFIAPASTGGFWNEKGLYTAAAGGAQNDRFWTTPFDGTVRALGGLAAGNVAVSIGGLVRVTTSGTLSFSWAADAAGTCTLRTDSFMTLRRIA